MNDRFNDLPLRSRINLAQRLTQRDLHRLHEPHPRVQSEVVPLRGVAITLSVAEVYAKAFGDR